MPCVAFKWSESASKRDRAAASESEIFSPASSVRSCSSGDESWKTLNVCHCFFCTFENSEKTMANSLSRAQRPQISPYLNATSWQFNWALKQQFESLCFTSYYFRASKNLDKWPDSDKCLKWAPLIWKNGRPFGCTVVAFACSPKRSWQTNFCLSTLFFLDNTIKIPSSDGEI